MIVVKVELWPGGDETTAKEITRMGIANVGTKQGIARYLVVSKDDKGGESHRFVEDHQREAGVEALIAKAVDAPLFSELPLATQEHFKAQFSEISKAMR